MKNFKQLTFGLFLALFSTHSFSSLMIDILGEDAFRNDQWSFNEIFQVDNDIVVTGLAAFDAGQDGFVSSGGIEVSIFDYNTSSLLATTFVQSSDVLVDEYRIADIDDLLLAAGTQYVLAAANRADLYNLTVGSYSPDFSSIGTGECISSTAVICSTYQPIIGRMANLEYAAAVPAPAPLALLGLGLAAIGYTRRRKA
ncbi:MAG: PEP-CTERM sorting domain-containing protein [Gammaproteobacteria bacterium]|nr:PEP-CTERM sorting domain-containing protein [Gammaproteobacteria bacterium]